jgi:hypothetical protein
MNDSSIEDLRKLLNEHSILPGRYFSWLQFKQRTITGGYLFQAIRYYKNLIEVDAKGNIHVAPIKRGTGKIRFNEEGRKIIKKFILSKKE